MWAASIRHQIHIRRQSRGSEEWSQQNLTTYLTLFPFGSPGSSGLYVTCFHKKNPWKLELNHFRRPEWCKHFSRTLNSNFTRFFQLKLGFSYSRFLPQDPSDNTYERPKEVDCAAIQTCKKYFPLIANDGQVKFPKQEDHGNGPI